MRIIKLDKIVFSISGNAAQFLNGLTSNTLDAPQNAFLNLHGRIIATFDQVKVSDDAFLISIVSAAVDGFLAHTERYAKLSRTTIEKTALNAYFDLDGNAPVKDGDWVIPQRKGRILLTDANLLDTISSSVFTLFRLEYQIPLHMIDYTDEMILNIDRGDFVSFTKGCFLGQEPVAKVHNRSKPSWRLDVCVENGVKGFKFVKNI